MQETCLTPHGVFCEEIDPKASNMPSINVSDVGSSGRQDLNRLPKNPHSAFIAPIDSIYTPRNTPKSQGTIIPARALVSRRYATRLTRLDLIFWVLRIISIITCASNRGYFPVQSDPRTKNTCNTSPFYRLIRERAYTSISEVLLQQSQLEPSEQGTGWVFVLRRR